MVYHKEKLSFCILLSWFNCILYSPLSPPSFWAEIQHFVSSFIPTFIFKRQTGIGREKIRDPASLWVRAICPLSNYCPVISRWNVHTLAKLASDVYVKRVFEYRMYNALWAETPCQTLTSRQGKRLCDREHNSFRQSPVCKLEQRRFPFLCTSASSSIIDFSLLRLESSFIHSFFLFLS